MDYIPVEYQKALNRRLKAAAVLVVAFCLTVLIYMLLAKIISPGEPMPGSEKWSKPIYYAIIIIGVLVVAIRRVMMSQLVMGPAKRRGVDTVLGRLTTMTVVCLVMAEAVAILGFLFFLWTGDYQYSWRLGLVSIFLIIYSFPRRGEWERAILSSLNPQSGATAIARQ